MKYNCLYCGKEILTEISLDEKGNTSKVYIPISCEECKNTSQLDDSHICIICKKDLQEIVLDGRIHHIGSPYCNDCGRKKTVKARLNNKCIICFEREQSNIPRSVGVKYELCEDCLKKWMEMLHRQELSWQYTRAIYRRRVK